MTLTRKAAKSKGINSTKPTVVAWPTIPPLAPHRPILEITRLLPSQILTLPLLSTSLSQQFLAFCQSNITNLLSTTPAKPKKGDAVRVNDRFQVDDPSFAEMLWTRTGIKEAIHSYEEDGKTSQQIWGGDVVGLNPNIRVYRYLKGQFFDKHYDDSNKLESLVDSVPIPCHTTYTLLIYLTSSPSIKGGETVFYTPSNFTPEIVVNPQSGMALLHAHGKECLLHEGKEVTDDANGMGKWILRSDLVVKDQ